MKEEEKIEKARREDGILFEGIVSFRAVLEGGRPILRLFYDREKAKKSPKELSFLRAKSVERNFQIELLSRAELDAMAVGGSHGGLLFLCGEREIPPLTPDALLPGGFYVMLDGIEDPYNFGYALRSLYAAGADGVLLPGRNWMTAAGIVCRASAGASELLPMLRAEDPETLCRCFREKGYRIVCAGMKNAISVDDANLLPPLLLVIGGEKRGIGQTILQNCDEIVRLEYGRDFPAALSAASAATVIGFEAARQMRQAAKH